MTHLELSVNCQRPAWASDERLRAITTPSYRLYIDDELLTERTWIYSDRDYLREVMYLNIINDVHKIHLESIGTDSVTAQFSLTDLTSNSHSVQIVNASNESIEFKIC